MRRTLEALGLALPAVAAPATALAYAPAHSLPLHLFWLWLLGIGGVVMGRAVGRAWPVYGGVWLGAGLIGAALLSPLAWGDRMSLHAPVADFTYGAAFTFASREEAIERTMALPDEWETLPVYLRVDLSRPYSGPARLAAEVNGEHVGELGPDSGAPDFEPPGGAPSWGLRVPLRVLRLAPAARVVVRPVQPDADLLIAVHPDQRITPRHLTPSRYFDGQSWHEDRILGRAHQADRAQRGAYRMWLLAS